MPAARRPRRSGRGLPGAGWRTPRRPAAGSNGSGRRTAASPGDQSAATAPTTEPDPATRRRRRRARSATSSSISASVVASTMATPRSMSPSHSSNASGPGQLESPVKDSLGRLLRTGSRGSLPSSLSATGTPFTKTTPPTHTRPQGRVRRDQHDPATAVDESGELRRPSCRAASSRSCARVRVGASGAMIRRRASSGGTMARPQIDHDALRHRAAATTPNGTTSTVQPGIGARRAGLRGAGAVVGGHHEHRARAASFAGAGQARRSPSRRRASAASTAGSAP